MSDWIFKDKRERERGRNFNTAFEQTAGIVTVGVPVREKFQPFDISIDHRIDVEISTLGRFYPDQGISHEYRSDARMGRKRRKIYGRCVSLVTTGIPGLQAGYAANILVGSRRQEYPITGKLMPDLSQNGFSNAKECGEAYFVH